MAGRFKVLTCAHEPRCSRQARPALAAWPQGSLSSGIAVPHSESRRRKAAVSVVFASLASSNALTEANLGTGTAAGCSAPATGTGTGTGADAMAAAASSEVGAAEVDAAYVGERAAAVFSAREAPSTGL